MAKQKYYVVWRGVQPGVYDNWNDASRQVNGFAGAQYKSFESRAEAESAYRGAYGDYVSRGGGGAPKKSKRTVTAPEATALGIDMGALAVDAACAGVPGPMEYRGVWVATGEEVFHEGPYDDGTNNIGEFLAIVDGLRWLKEHGYASSVAIYSDSYNARKWVRDKVCRTNVQPTSRNGVIFTLIEHALQWLKSNDANNRILTWDTERWGENPADFGRK